jgi:hypothetical protein
MKDIELAWAAGFFEGEGCVYIDKKGPYLRINLAQVDDPYPLERFARAVGIGTVKGPHKLRDIKRRYAYDLSKGAREVMEMLAPYLGERSKKLADFRQACLIDSGERGNRWHPRAVTPRP